MLEPGQVISHYRLTAKLGAGGMGVVYEAQDERLTRRVAMKFLADELTDDVDAIRRLRREAQTVALLNHPNICTIFDIDEYQGRTFLVMERLDGKDLRNRLAQAPLHVVDTLKVALDVAEALRAAHTAGVVHRDIKPGNIFISADGRAKVLDFGLARRVVSGSGASGPDGSSIPGRPIGTIDYMAPERLLQFSQDGRCDLFSLGVVMYEMATGRRPFTGGTPFETLTNILDGDALSLAAQAPDQPVELDEIVRKLTARKPDHRYLSARVLIDDLTTLLSREEKKSGGRKRWPWGKP